MKISLIDWDGCRAGIVHSNPVALARFLRRLEKQGGTVKVVDTMLLSSFKMSDKLRAGWERSARDNGAVWACGLSAL